MQNPDYSINSLEKFVKPLTESDIRPDDAQGTLREMVELDARWVMSRQSEFVDVRCPACEHFAGDIAFEKQGFKYRDCKKCGTLFISPRPTQAIIADLYKHSKAASYFSSVIFTRSESARRDRIIKPRARRLLDMCMQYGVPPETLAEVGPGSGLFCAEMKALNYFRNIIAVEPIPELARSCVERGVEVVNSMIEDADLSACHVTAMVAFEVIEHLFSPKAFLMACKQQLEPGGVVVLSCPNIKGFDLSLLREKSDNVGHEHKNYFNPSSLQCLLERIGFDVIDVQTPGQLDAEIVRKKVLDGTLDLSSNAFLRQVLVDEWDQLGAPFQEFLVSNRLSSHLWVLARKES